MANGKPKTSRRRDTRRTTSQSERWWSKYKLSQPVLWSALWVALLTFFGGLMVLSGQSRPKYKVGEPLNAAVVSRVPFKSVDLEKTSKKRRDEAARQLSVYRPNTPYFEKLRNDLLALGRLARNEEIESLVNVPQDTQKRLWLNTVAKFQALRAFVNNPANVPWETLVDQFMEAYASIAVVRPQEQVAVDEVRFTSPVIIRHAVRGNDEVRQPEDLIDVTKDRKVLEARLEVFLAEKLPPAVSRLLLDNAIDIQNPQPTYELDVAETSRRREIRAAAVPTQEIEIQSYQVLVRGGPNQKLSEMDVLLLEKEEATYLDQLGLAKRWLIRMGNFGLMFVVSLGLWIYIGVYKPRVSDKPWRGASLMLLILGAQVIAVVTTLASPTNVNFTAVFPVLLVTTLIAIAYDRRFALAVGAIVTVIVMLSLGRGVESGIVLLTGVTVTASLLNEVRTRSTLVLTGLWSGVAMVVTAGLVGLTDLNLDSESQFQSILWNQCLVFLAAVATGMFVQALLPAVETIFRVTTFMTLKDLNDSGKPLLRRLAQDAPGTYQHSLRIADMAEAAATAIGESGLLCRVGAMYHDIGKINKPQYFVENQGGGPNKHRKLKPAMSLLVIVGHVKDGMEMAREAGLPRDVRHFIESHHGTTLVEYFYHAAKKQSEGDEDVATPTEFEYRYPGPKPQTKEAAILMICDCVEGAARAMPEPTPVRLEQLVHKLLTKRLMDGQFDDCNITLKELHLVEQAIVKMVCAIYHGRIAYPSDRERTNPAPSSQPASAAV